MYQTIEFKAIVQDLKTHLESSYFSKLIDESISIVQDNNYSLNINFFSLIFRELITKILQNKSPDEEIKKCIWFTYDNSSKNGITRIQRINYLIHGGIDPNYIKENLIIKFDEAIKDLKSKFENLNKYVHLSEKTVIKTDQEKYVIVRSSFSSLLEVITAAEALSFEIGLKFMDNASDKIKSILIKHINKKYKEQKYNITDINILVPDAYISSQKITFKVEGIINLNTDSFETIKSVSFSFESSASSPSDINILEDTLIIQ